MFPIPYLVDKHGGLVQSLLLLVEDANDNPPLFIQPPTSVTVKESGTYQLKKIMAVVIRSNVFYNVEQTIVQFVENSPMYAALGRKIPHPRIKSGW